VAKPDGATPLFLAAQEGYTELVDLLLDAGASIDLPDEDGISPLYIACYQGHLDVVASLLRAGANPNKLGLDGTSPVFIAAQEGYADIVEILAMHSADVNLLDQDGTAPLLMAAQEGRVTAVSVLLALGADPNTLTPRGVRPVHSAAQNGHLKTVQLLQAYGADVKILTQSGASAIRLATDFSRLDVAAWISEGAEWSPLRVCAEAGLHWVARDIFSSGKAEGMVPCVAEALLLRARASAGSRAHTITANTFARALSAWAPRNHTLFSPRFRKVVRLVLLVRYRLSYHDSKLPIIPPEMWFAVLGQIGRLSEAALPVGEGQWSVDS